MQTMTLSITVGVACSFYPSGVVLEALALTAAIVVGLTAYTFRAIRQGADFSMMGPLLFCGLMTTFVWGLIQAFLPVPPVAQTIFALLGAVVFSGGHTRTTWHSL